MRKFRYSDPYEDPYTGEAASLSSSQRYADSVRSAIARGAGTFYRAGYEIGAPMMDEDEIRAREDLADIGRRGSVKGVRVA